MTLKMTKTGDYEGPERYVGPWAAKAHFILRTLLGNRTAIVTVANGMQPSEGVEHLTLRDARLWMRDNGFVFTPENNR